MPRPNDNDFLFDTRLVEHHFRRSKLNRDTLNAHLNGLADDADEGAETETRFEPNFERRAETPATAEE